MKWSLLVVGLMVLPGCLESTDDQARFRVHFPDATSTAGSDSMTQAERGCPDAPPRRDRTPCVGVGFVDHVVLEIPTEGRRPGALWYNDSVRIWPFTRGSIEILEADRYEGWLREENGPVRLEITVRAEEPGWGALFFGVEWYRETAPEDLPKKWPRSEFGQIFRAYEVMA